MRNILISGAGSGIGRATALRLAQDGGEFWLIGRKREPLEETAELLQKFKVQAHIHDFDVSDEAATTHFFNNAKQPFGICVNNAGIEGDRAEIQNLTLQAFDEVFNVNVRALFHFVKEEVRLLRKFEKQGSIVNLSSIAGIIGIPTSSMYCAAKAAVSGMTKAVALEQIRYGIRVNAICPGATDTAMMRRILGDSVESFIQQHPSGRMGKPEEIAEAIAWLCHENSKFVVGQSIVIDGGATIG